MFSLVAANAQEAKPVSAAVNVNNLMLCLPILMLSVSQRDYIHNMQSINSLYIPAGRAATQGK